MTTKTSLLFPYDALNHVICCKLHVRHAAITAAIYTLNISILVVLLYSWRVQVNIKKYEDLQDVYYGVQIAYFAIIGTQLFMVFLSILLLIGIFKVWMMTKRIRSRIREAEIKYLQAVISEERTDVISAIREDLQVELLLLKINAFMLRWFGHMHHTQLVLYIGFFGFSLPSLKYLRGIGPKFYKGPSFHQIVGNSKEKTALIVPWVIGFIALMALEAVSGVYSNVLRDHVNKQFDALCKAELAFFISRTVLNVIAIYSVMKFHNLLRAGITWKGPEAIEL